MFFLKRCLLLLVTVVLFPLPPFLPTFSFAASSVYIPGVPSASSSAIGISCNYGGLGAGTVLCSNSSPGPIVTCNAGVCTSAAGYQNRLMFVAPGVYGWSVPAGVTKFKLVVIGAGSGSDNTYGGNGGGYSETTITVSGGQPVSVNVGQGGGYQLNGGPSSITVNGVSINAGGGTYATWGHGTHGCGSGGSINTCGGISYVNGGGVGAAGPYANGGYGGTYGGGGFGTFGGCCQGPGGQYGGYAFGMTATGLSNPIGSNSIWWDPRDIMGNGGKAAAGIPLNNAGEPNVPGLADDGGLGAGGGACSINGCFGGAGVTPYAGSGGFGGGGGPCICGGGVGGSGGIGAGAGADASLSVTGGNGIAIIYW